MASAPACGSIPRTGTGIAFFATGLGEDPPRGRTSYRAIEEWLARRPKLAVLASAFERPAALALRAGAD